MPPAMEEKLSPHFARWEMQCKHCGKLPPGGISSELLDRLEALRARIGRPINVNSGYRCPTHNKQVSKAAKSQHVLGTAADIWVEKMDPVELLIHAHAVGFRGLFLYDRFVHVDVRPTLAGGDYRTKE